jgi:nitrite reductase (NADH) small subunit
MTALQNLAATAARAPESPTDPPRRPLAVWVRVCTISDLERERGLAALIDGEQVALFRTHEDRIHAVQQLDPYSGAYVMSRGIVGTKGDAPTVASPMYKQVFDLRTGACLETQGKDEYSLQVWPVAVDDSGDVFIKWKAPS